MAIIGTRGYPSYYGGFETAVRKLAPYLESHNWKVTVYGRSGPRVVHLSERLTVRRTWGLQNEKLSTLSYGFSASIHAALARSDVALVMNVANGYFLPILRIAGVPTVVNVDGIEWDRGKWGPFGRRVFKVGAQLTARFATTLIFDAREIARIWAELFSATGVYIPYGADGMGGSHQASEFDDRQYVLLVARFVPENSLPEFLEAAKHISKFYDVVLVGSSGFGGEIEQVARRLDEESPRVHWLGHVADDRRLFSLWKNAAVYFHGHTVGGTNPALVQAMALGVPTVARDTPYNREVLGDGGVFVGADPTSMGAEVVALLGDAAKQAWLSTKVSARLAADFGWEDVCSAYEAVLVDAVEEGRV